MAELNQDPLVLRIGARADLASMNAGKLAAQVSHAASAIAAQAMDHGKPASPDYVEWMNQTGDGFGTLTDNAMDARLNALVRRLN